jgi:hypothetical protein
MRRLTWFVATSSADTPRANDRGVDVGHAVFHAKTFGTVATACGMYADTWQKYWDVPFRANLPGACSACVSQVEEHRRGRSRVR